ncbi:MAG: DNA gyrase inhibitor YacG [Planctomycetaceae bacterium]|nr:DNA gyrase inhibitor YacG [Planctomycetaceae bacterium]
MKTESQTCVNLKCPVCNRSFDINSSGVAMPFCSTRCKQIDAKRWLNEEYGLPYETEQNQIENEILNNMYGLEDNE